MTINGMDRAELERRNLAIVSRLLPKDKYDDYRRHLSALPDSAFFAYMEECKKAYEAHPISLKEELEGRMKIQRHLGITDNTSAFGSEEVMYLAKETIDMLWQRMSKTHPSDTIRMSGSDDQKLLRLWKKDNSTPVPSDLFFSGNIPLMDCEISVDERDITPESAGGTVISYRVVIFQDYRKEIEESDDVPVCVGCIDLPHSGGKYHMIVPILVVKGFDNLLISPGGWHGISNPDRLTKLTGSDIASFGNAFMSTWYSIQIALLHPEVKEVFSHPEMTRIYDNSFTGNKKRRKTRYIRRHVIKKGEIDSVLTAGRTYVRHTLVWYVIGHWRHYPGGGRTFIKGYWKGALRSLKQNIDDGRDREIVLPEEG